MVVAVVAFALFLFVFIAVASHVLHAQNRFPFAPGPSICHVAPPIGSASAVWTCSNGSWVTIPTK